MPTAARPVLLPHRLAASAASAASAGAAAALLAGCSSGPDSGAAVDVTRDFYRAVVDGDGAAACRLLAPAALEGLEEEAGLPCADALLDDEVGPELTAAAEQATGATAQSVTVAGRNAQVVLDGEVSFLVVSGGGWRISATGCAPRPERPYDCLLEGA
ncbi:hypothetical protein [Cellulomonas timonensis]|uniref:hypothetical protein n=1 Tax=Cellulomonas timonensis TaxID=1689271 RepID=UPI000830EFD6|nr:hypothetical protein [Cellulomonas timonensis]